MARTRMSHTGDVALAREQLHRRKGHNMLFLLEKRFAWMRPYLADAARAVEVGCGAGFSREFLKHESLELTDVVAQPWVDRVVDALDMPYESGSLDAVISNNMIHHLAKPAVFFAEVARVLRPGGVLLVQEVNCSLSMQAALTLMHHEDYDFGVDPFDPNAVCNDPADPWSANCALPNLLFDDPARFERAYPAFTIEDQAFSEFLVFFNSGGVIARTAYLPLPRAGVRVLDAIDRLLVGAAPKVFAGQRRVVLRKRPVVTPST